MRCGWLVLLAGCPAGDLAIFKTTCPRPFNSVDETHVLTAVEGPVLCTVGGTVYTAWISDVDGVADVWVHRGVEAATPVRVKQGLGDARGLQLACSLDVVAATWVDDRTGEEVLHQNWSHNRGDDWMPEDLALGPSTHHASTTRGSAVITTWTDATQTHQIMVPGDALPDRTPLHDAPSTALAATPEVTAWISEGVLHTAVGDDLTDHGAAHQVAATARHVVWSNAEGLWHSEHLWDAWSPPTRLTETVPETLLGVRLAPDLTVLWSDASGLVAWRPAPGDHRIYEGAVAAAGLSATLEHPVYWWQDGSTEVGWEINNQRTVLPRWCMEEPVSVQVEGLGQFAFVVARDINGDVWRQAPL